MKIQYKNQTKIIMIIVKKAIIITKICKCQIQRQIVTKIIYKKKIIEFIVKKIKQNILILKC
jgi:hypothetical protein